MPRPDLLKSRHGGCAATDVARAVARLVEELGKPSLGVAVLDFLRARAFFDSGLILLYRPRRKPRVLVEALAHPLRGNDVEAYLAGAYLLDPFRMHAQTLREPAVVRLQDITADDFRSSEYFRTYYGASRLTDEVNFLIPLAADQGCSAVAVCLGRSQSLAPFDDAQIAGFRAWLPMLSAVLRRHVAMLGNIEGTRSAELEDREHDRLEARLAMFGATLLTRREHEVVQHLLHGVSAPAIAARLHVSLQTVRVHRRNIYAKLDVSSLGQLFALAMHSLLVPVPGDL